MSNGSLGIVVIGRNEGQRLIDCLKSAKPYGGHLIYVDSGSRDGSAEAAEKLGAHVVRLRDDRAFTAARARNEGLAALIARDADVRFVQFVDGDCELADGWVPAALDFISSKERVAVVCGRRRERYPERSFFNRLCDIEWNSPIGETLACGGDSLVRVEAFNAVGGFRPQLVAGEEPELCARLRRKRWKIWRLDADMTRHDAAMTRFGQWWARAVRSGYGYAGLSSLEPPVAVYRREKTRAVIWGGLLPLLIAIGSALNLNFAWGLLLYPVQIVRVAIRRGAGKPESWIYALFMTVAKFAELQGILKFYWHRWRGNTARLTEYK
jgi:glycosyltransferase involved in cell wall biosynthesis